MRVEPSGAAKALWPLISRMGRKQYERDFARLKAVLEGRAAQTADAAG